jgi:hypothetical protein
VVVNEMKRARMVYVCISAGMKMDIFTFTRT